MFSLKPNRAIFCGMSQNEVLSFRVQPPSISYELIIGKNLVKEALTFAKSLSSQVFLITTAEVASLLPDLDQEKIVLPSGETIKSRAIKEKLEDFLIEKRAGKECFLVGIGGGALLDLVGFVAATYCRGVSYISIPTTLIAMTDAAIGGKTGINHEFAKNWFGSFHHPKKIFIDSNFLFSLPEKDYICGLSETIKHSLIADKEFFLFLEQNLEKLLRKDAEVIQETVVKSCSIKKKLIEKDPFETVGVRRILNFGHTVGHALETLSNYTLSHGEAVFMGLLLESAISHIKGFLSEEEALQIFRFLKRIPAAFSLPKQFPFSSLERDKKGAYRMVFLKSIGEVVSFEGVYTEKLSEKEFEKGLEYVSRTY